MRNVTIYILFQLSSVMFNYDKLSYRIILLLYVTVLVRRLCVLGAPVKPPISPPAFSSSGLLPRVRLSSPECDLRAAMVTMVEPFLEFSNAKEGATSQIYFNRKAIEKKNTSHHFSIIPFPCLLSSHALNIMLHRGSETSDHTAINTHLQCYETNVTSTLPAPVLRSLGRSAV